MSDMMGMTEYLVINDRVVSDDNGDVHYYLDVLGPDGQETWDVDDGLWEQVGHGDTLRHSDEEGFWMSVG